MSDYCKPDLYQLVFRNSSGLYRTGKKKTTLQRSLRIQTQVVLKLLLLIVLDLFVTHSTVKEEQFDGAVYKLN